MALKSCRECGADVSTQAEACPRCGVPNPTWVSMASVGRTPRIAPLETRRGILPWIMIGGLVCVLVVVGAREGWGLGLTELLGPSRIAFQLEDLQKGVDLEASAARPQSVFDDTDVVQWVARLRGPIGITNPTVVLTKVSQPSGAEQVVTQSQLDIPDPADGTIGATLMLPLLIPMTGPGTYKLRVRAAQRVIAQGTFEVHHTSSQAE